MLTTVLLSPLLIVLQIIGSFKLAGTIFGIPLG